MALKTNEREKTDASADESVGWHCSEQTGLRESEQGGVTKCWAG